MSAILVVCPPYEFSRPGGGRVFIPDPATVSLVSYLRDRGVDSLGYLPRGTGPPAVERFVEETIHLVREHNVRVLGISINYMPGITPARILSRVIRDLLPEVCIVAGGALVTGLILECEATERLPDINFFVKGDGEEWLYWLSQDFNRSFSKGRSTVLPQIDTPSYDLAPMLYDGVLCAGDQKGVYTSLEHYKDRENVSLEIINGRSCPFGCRFCISPQMGEHRVASLSTLSRSVSELSRLGVSRFTFDDNHFNLPINGFAERMAALSVVSARFDAQARFGYLRDGDVERFAEAGGHCLYFGGETLVASVQQEIGKKVSLDVIKGDCDRCHEAGVNVALNLLFGLPGSSETLDQLTLAKAWSLSEKGLIDLVSAGVFVPLPGTAYWRDRRIRIADDELWNWDGDHAVVDILDAETKRWYTATRIMSVYESALGGDLPTQIGIKRDAG